MRAYDLIRSRRSIHDFEAVPIAAEVVERCLEAATYAPNLGLTQPWRFTVLREGAKARLAGAVAAFGAVHAPAPGCAAAGPLRAADVAVAVGQVADPDLGIRATDRLAVAASIENLLLCAWDEGVGGLWIGGPVLEDADVRGAAGAVAGCDLVALLALGYPEAVPPLPRRRTAAEVIRWVRE